MDLTRVVQIMGTAPDLTVEEALDVLRAHAAASRMGTGRLAGALVRGETATHDVLGTRCREPR